MKYEQQEIASQTKQATSSKTCNGKLPWQIPNSNIFNIGSIAGANIKSILFSMNWTKSSNLKQLTTSALVAQISLTSIQHYPWDDIRKHICLKQRWTFRSTDCNALAFWILEPSCIINIFDDLLERFQEVQSNTKSRKT